MILSLKEMCLAVFFHSIPDDLFYPGLEGSLQLFKIRTHLNVYWCGVSHSLFLILYKNTITPKFSLTSWLVWRGVQWGVVFGARPSLRDAHCKHCKWLVSLETESLTPHSPGEPSCLHSENPCLCEALSHCTQKHIDTVCSESCSRFY